MLIGLDLVTLACLALVGVALDLLLGEARRWHPLVGFGKLAAGLESVLNARRLGYLNYAAGLLAWFLAVSPPLLLCWWLLRAMEREDALVTGLVHALLLYFCIGLRSLREHALPIQRALENDDLVSARLATARIVSRDTADAQPSDLARAGVESLLENGNDAVFGTLFWFAIAGGPGAVLFRLANTLDAMWGYRTRRYRTFGWAAARIDDVLNWLPARLTAVSYALLGNTRQAWRCWRAQAPAWSSPNAGPVMAAGAGALGVALGGAARYAGVLEERPPLGSGQPPQASDIGRAWRLVARATALWLIVLVLAAVFAGIGERVFHA